MILAPFSVVRTRLGAAARALFAELRTGHPGTEGGDDDETYDAADVRQPLGLFARPFITGTVEALVARVGDEALAFFLADRSGARFDDCDEGETRLYASKFPDCCVRLRADGSMSLDASGAAMLTLQSGTQPFVRGTDLSTALNNFATAVSTFATAVAAYTAAESTASLASGDAFGFLTLSPSSLILGTAASNLAAAAAALAGALPGTLSTRIQGT